MLRLPSFIKTVKVLFIFTVLYRVLPVENSKGEFHHWILHSRISLGIKFQLKLTDFWTKFATKVSIWSKTKKWASPLNSHIRISLGTEFQLNLTSLIFWTKFAKKECFRPKTKKVNRTIEFSIFEVI